MIDSEQLEAQKKKYPFLETILKEGYGKGHDLFQISEFDSASGLEHCFVSGCHSSAEFVSWRWSGIKDNQIVDLSSHNTVTESLKNKNLDYLLCEEILTLERDDHDYQDLTISIYKINGESAK